MLSSQRPTTSTASTSRENNYDHDQENEHFRDIHALTPPHPLPVPQAGHWETGSQRSYSMSMTSEGALSQNFTTMSTDFSALVLAGSTVESINSNNNNSISDANDVINGNNMLSRIGEDEVPEETNPFAIVPDNNPLTDPGPASRTIGSDHLVGGGAGDHVSVQRVKKEEVETKITAWQNAKTAKINNRFKREDAVINGWQSEQVHKASSRMKKVERKLEEKRARALEKMQNEVAKANRKAEERRASAEAKRGTKVAKVLEIANLMRAVGRPPVKRSFF